MIELTQAEVCLICDSLNGTYLDESSFPNIWLAVADGVRLNALDMKWGVAHPDELVQRLRDMSPEEAEELAAGVGRFWKHPELDTADGLRAAGLAFGGAP